MNDTNLRKLLNQLDMKQVWFLYNERVAIHQELKKLLEIGKVDINGKLDKYLCEYLEIALGIKKYPNDLSGNYSASDHAHGSKIIALNKEPKIIELAKSFLTESDSEKMLESIFKASLKYLKVSIGSEMAMMLNPKCFWVANVRTIWTHILIKPRNKYDVYHISDAVDFANEELYLYRTQDYNTQERTSEMEYRKWREICLEMDKKLSIGNICAITKEMKNGMQIDTLPYLWFDAVANSIYVNFAHAKQRKQFR